jgi:FkbM family methyltransferase
MLSIFIRNSAVRLFGLTAGLGLHRLLLFSRSFLTFYSFYKNHFEAGPIDRLKDFVPVGSLVIDVGANVGFFSQRFAKWVGERGKVIAIEPEDRNFRYLIMSLESKGLAARVRSIKAVAADTPGKMRLQINNQHPGDHRISPNGIGISVDAVTLDGLVEDMRPSRPSLIKVDVQGAEMLVLRGAREILTNVKPTLFIELSEEALGRFGSSVSEILNHLAQLGYLTFWLTRAGPPVEATVADIHAKVRQKNYVDVLFLSSSRALSATVADDGTPRLI